VPAAQWLPAALLLSAALALGPVALRLERQGKRLAQRVDAATDAAAQDIAARGISIRIARGGRGRPHAWASALLRVPMDQKLAHVVPVPLVLAAGVVMAAAVLWVVRIFLPLPATIALAATVLVLVPRGIFGWEQDRYRDALFAQLPDAIEIVVSATRAGLPVAEAFRGIVREMPKPISHEFGRVMNEIALGVPSDEALMGVHDRTGLSEFAIFAVTIGIQGKSGGRLTESIQNLAEVVRQRITVAARARALAAEAKLSARVISVMPIAGGVMMEFLHPGYLAPLIDDPRGRNMLVVGVGSLVTGTLMIRRMIAGVTRE